MKRVKNLNLYQRLLLTIMPAMALVFAILYSITISKVGFYYKNTILKPIQENDCVIYSGKIEGQPTCFTVSEDKKVVFQYGSTTYGPYSVKEDPTAVPHDENRAEYMTGVEVYRGEKLLFRGGVWNADGSYWLYKEDGTMADTGIFYVSSDGIERDQDGNRIDPAEPSVATILELIDGPVLTHKGAWYAWCGAVCISILNALSILFADELFRWNLSFRIRHVEDAEPSDWELAERYIGWTVLTIMTLVIFVMGLQ